MRHKFSIISIFLLALVAGCVTATPLPTDTPTPAITNTPMTQEEYRATFIAAGKPQKTKMAQEQTAVVAVYTQVDTSKLVAYPNDYKGQKVKITGEVFNINSHYEFQIFVNDDDAVYVVTDKSVTLSEGQNVTIYGVASGENCGTNAMGGKICQPLILDAFVK